MQYVLKFLLCILKWILIVVIVASLGVGAFTYCMDYANISILVTDGMKILSTPIFARARRCPCTSFAGKQTVSEGMVACPAM